MAVSPRLLPANATLFELSIATVTDPWARLADLVASIPDLDANPPAVMLPFLVWQYGLGELSPYLPNLYDLINEGLAWQRIRGTPGSVTMALGWLGYTGTLEEEPSRRIRWNRFQIGLGQLPPADLPDLDRLDGVVSLSPPVRSDFGRGYRGWDIRTCEASFQRFGASNYSDHSGIRTPTGQAQWSFGREQPPIAYEFTQADLTALGCWSVPAPSPDMWATDDRLWTSVTTPWWNDYAQARRSGIVAALTANACYITFRDAGGDVLGYSRAIFRGVASASSGDYTINGASYAAGATPTSAIAFTRSPFNAADMAVVASVDLAFNPTLAAGSMPGALWLGPAGITSATHVAQTPISITMAGAIREHITFLLDLDTQITGAPSGYSFSTFAGVPLTFNGASVFDNGNPAGLSVRT